MTTFNEQHLDTLLDNFAAVEERLTDPSVTSDTDKMMKLSRERSRLEPVVQLIRQYRELKNQLSEIKSELSAGTVTGEMLEVMQSEQNSLIENLGQTEKKLQLALLPSDPDEGKNIFLEIRAGTGGDEAALFARDLMRMYTRYFEKQSIAFDTITISDTGLNGIKEAVLLVKDEKAYSLLKHEGGTHRVQRIPETESGGRIHTSACTVAVIPEAEESEIEISADELRIDVFRSSGAGGQHVNTTDSAVRITHIPSGVVVSCQDEKSQHKNKAKAMKVLRARLGEKQRSENHEQAAAEKKAQIGSGDRSEKIRTYNFPQSRITDHRINYTAHNLDKVMEGGLDELFDTLNRIEREKKLEQLQEDL